MKKTREQWAQEMDELYEKNLKLTYENQVKYSEQLENIQSN